MSLKKIAEMTGVSVSTVSRVLNQKNESCASEQVKEKIWQAAGEIGYQPNVYARSLKKKESPEESARISVIMARNGRTSKDPFFEELCRHLQSEFVQTGCRLGKILYAGEKGTKVFVDQKIPDGDGYIILGRCPAKLLTALQERTENLIGIWRNPAALPMDEVICRGDKAAEMAIEYLLSLGHRKIAYIGDCSYENRYVGYSECLIKNKIPIDYPLIYDVAQTRAAGARAMENLLRTNGATAALCANDELALGALEELKRQKRNRKNPISVISIDDIREAGEAGLTTIHMPQKDMAHMAVMLLLDRIKKGHQEKLCLEMPCNLMERESCYYLIT